VLYVFVFILFYGFWLELKLATRLKVTLITTTTKLFIVPVVVDLLAVSTVAGKCYMKMPTLIQKIIVPYIMGSCPGRVKPKTLILVFVASPQHYEERAKTALLEIRLMCPSGATCQYANCCLSELAL
jgi:hypothetical protein